MDKADLLKMLCTCQEMPLGLDFVLTSGCLVHDRCMCHEDERRQELAPSVQAVTRRATAPGSCLWCGSFIALLKGVASLDASALATLHRALRER